ncbi:hypothetical protein SSP24_62450 [Streptomyces spinoverrucosus]|uniref:HTH tetR-type domain-containing protein n=1 Tax=Streptomyces spinoverrucosus TaxID=284043 RepID=A0A4Y3VSF5_9ACTN|nr:hypothetical protein SSP24_62450 [Streptomyces spinoverrucosus]GHB68985.1 hypothetical protein GCM10010397_44160 [Streptomyces spinoverrucosus]
MGRTSAQERRQSAIRAATAEFALRGYYGTSTEAIAQRVGVTQKYRNTARRRPKRLLIQMQGYALVAAAQTQGDDRIGELVRTGWMRSGNGKPGGKAVEPAPGTGGGVSTEGASVARPARKGDASAHACRIEQGGHRGGDESGEAVGSDPRAGAGAVEDQAELSGQQVGIARTTLLGLGPEEGRQVPLDPVGHLARGVALILELDLDSQYWQPRNSGAAAPASTAGAAGTSSPV